MYLDQDLVGTIIGTSEEVPLDHKFEKAAETLRSSKATKYCKMFANLEIFRLYVHRQCD
jgi:hypothetical protein